VTEPAEQPLAPESSKRAKLLCRILAALKRVFVRKPRGFQNTHLDDRSALITCSIIGRETIIESSPAATSKRGVALGCYRALLCDKEGRDCWYAKPMTSRTQPFDFGVATTHVKTHGQVFEWGLNPVVLITGSSLPASTKRLMLEELLTFPKEFSPWNYTPDEARRALGLVLPPPGT
jgi:hypothetical protein